MIRASAVLLLTFGLASLIYAQVKPQPCAVCKVPEPSSIAELVIGVVGTFGVGFLYRRKRSDKSQ
jgi:hypothetical protein